MITEVHCWHSELETVLLVLDDCQVECDGMTYLVSHALEDAGIEHQCMLGHVKDKTSGDFVTPHCWIKLPGGYIIDLRLRMWLGDYDYVPHGVFKLAEHPDYAYMGNLMHKPNLRLSVLQMISDNKFSHVKIPPLDE